MMKRRLVALLLGGLLAAMSATPVLAAQPPGQIGYEGQPGHQSGSTGHHQGHHGYEGQPGHQSGSN